MNHHREVAKSVGSGIRQICGQRGQEAQLAAADPWSNLVPSLRLGFLISQWGYLAHNVAGD